MPPQENTQLLSSDSELETSVDPQHSGLKKWCTVGFLVFVVANAILWAIIDTDPQHGVPIGPYKLLERQEGADFFDYYTFFDGEDSLGSAGYNTYVGKKEAMKLGLANVTTEDGIDYVYMSSTPTEDGPRSSVRLEGKRRFDRGLFILDLEHMPAGCGVWPAFWLTDEEHWPDNGEIDIVEGVNTQTRAKTALHTSESCSMYGHVSPFSHTGEWDSATGIPNTWTGQPDNETHVPADNCWNYAPHQWFNQGCVAVNTEPDTIGEPLNANGGGIYALEWDPEAGHIKSWVFPTGLVPDNLQDVLDGPSTVVPEPETWDLPYAYFAIGDKSGCSSDHFKNMRIVLNLAFCGTVAGNRFLMDCPEKAAFAATLLDEDKATDSWALCNAYIESNPKELEEAYWKIRGSYVFEREYELKHDNKTGKA